MNFACNGQPIQVFIMLCRNLMNIGEGYRLQEAVNSWGWEVTKRTFPEVRRLLQTIGTEGGREVLGDNVWIDAAFGRMEAGKRYVVTDLRFVNEARKIAVSGGKTIRVHRKNAVETGHASERDLDHWVFDAHIDNNGDLDDLREQAQNLLDKWL